MLRFPVGFAFSREDREEAMGNGSNRWLILPGEFVRIISGGVDDLRLSTLVMRAMMLSKKRLFCSLFGNTVAADAISI